MRVLLLILSFISLACSLVIGCLIAAKETPTSGLYIVLSCFLSLSAVWFGWWLSTHLARRQNTINIILQSRLSSEYLTRLDTLNVAFPLGKKITADDVNDSNNIEAARALLVVLNFLEFIAVGIKSGDLSESVCKSYFCQIFANQWYRCSDYIHTLQIQDSEGTFCNFEYYSKKWNPILTK